MNNSEDNEIIGLLRGIRQEDTNEEFSESSSLQTKPSGTNVVNVPTEKTALESTFSTTPEKTRREHEKSLSKWQGFFYNRQIGKLRKEEALKIANAMYEREFESVIQKLTLSLDIEKKRTFIEYMRSTAGLQRELQQLDAAARLSLSQALMEINIKIYEVTNDNEKTLSDLLRRGVISKQQAENERIKNQDLSKRNLDDSMLTLENMWSNHKQLLEYTLKLFLEDLTGRGKI